MVYSFQDYDVIRFDTDSLYQPSAVQRLSFFIDPEQKWTTGELFSYALWLDQGTRKLCYISRYGINDETEQLSHWGQTHLGHSKY